MKIGILSDSHDNLPNIISAVKIFNSSKVDFVLHAGDFVAPFTVPRLEQLRCRWLGVFGNNDGEKKGLFEKSKGKIRNPPLRINLGGRDITIVHDMAALKGRKRQGQVIIFGHTHKPSIKSLGRKLLINPGECCGWLSGKPSIAILDLEKLKAKIIAI